MELGPYILLVPKTNWREPTCVPPTGMRVIEYHLQGTQKAQSQQHVCLDLWSARHIAPHMTMSKKQQRLNYKQYHCIRYGASQYGARCNAVNFI